MAIQMPRQRPMAPPGGGGAPTPGMPPGAPPGGGVDAFAKAKGMRSGFNPSDVAMDTMDGKFDPNMSVIEFLQANNIDPQGSVMQFRDMFMNQMKNADPMQKMQGLAQGGGRPMPAGGPAGRPAPVAPQGGDVGPRFDKMFRQ